MITPAGADRRTGNGQHRSQRRPPVARARRLARFDTGEAACRDERAKWFAARRRLPFLWPVQCRAAAGERGRNERYGLAFGPGSIAARGDVECNVDDWEWSRDG